MGKPTLTELLRTHSGGNVLQLFGDHRISSQLPLGRLEQQADRLPEFLTFEQLKHFFQFVSNELGQMGYPVRYIVGEPRDEVMRGLTRHQLELRASEAPNDWIVLMVVNTLASESEHAVRRILLKQMILEVVQGLEFAVALTR